MGLASRLVGRLTGRGAGRPRADRSGRRTVLVLVLLVSLSLTVAALFGRQGLLELVRYRAERQRLLEEIAALELEVERLETEIQALDSDPGAIERLAREELGLAREGEILVFLDSEESRDPRRSEGWTSPGPTD